MDCIHSRRKVIVGGASIQVVTFVPVRSITGKTFSVFTGLLRNKNEVDNNDKDRNYCHP